jgi:hypothetical protein
MLYQRIKRMDTETKLGKRIISHFIPEEYRKKFSAHHKERSRTRMIRNVCRDRNAQLKDLFHTCLEHISPVTEPLALISQIQYAGGMLLNHLFDGHPEVHSHPHELLIGYPEKDQWPKIDVKDDPQRWFEILFENTMFEYAQNGYCRRAEEKQTFPFIFLPSLQREIFLKYIDSIQSVNLRDVFDSYMTSYFGAWLSNQNDNGRKKFVTAYAPGLSTSRENMEVVFEIYPDGRLISVVRDPKSWFVCAQRHEPEKYGDLKRALSQWEEDAQAMLRNRDRYGDRVCIVRFEDLVGKTNAVMHYLADFLGIEVNEILLVPTFNKFPIKAHTSFKVEDHGIVNGPLSRYSTLTDRQLDIMEKMTGETLTRVLNKVVRFE